MVSASAPLTEVAALRKRIVETRSFPEEHDLRDEIARSWRRCLINGVDPGRPTAPPKALSNPDALIVKAARDIVLSRADLLTDSPVGLMVADRHALVVSRTFGDDRLAALLRESGSEEGNNLDEAVVGTNGVGTALEEQAIVQIVGPEHFTDAFREFSCVGIPIRHPINRRVLGVLNMTCLVEAVNSLMVPFAQETARAIEEQLYLHSSRSERILLHHFLTMQRRSDRPLVALNDQLMISNPAATRVLEDVEQSRLWELAANAVESRTPSIEDLITPSGESRRLRFTVAEDTDSDVGVLVEVLPSSERAPAGFASPTVRTREPRLPGLVGRSGAWRQVEDAAMKVHSSHLPMLVRGARGTGKMAVISALFAAQAASGRLHVFDCRMQAVEGTAALAQKLRAAMADGEAVVVLSHVSSLEPRAADAVSALIDEAGPGTARIIGVCADEPETEPSLIGLLERLAVASLQLPLLRDRLEDLPDLLTALSDRHSPDGSRMRWTDEAVQQLGRLNWPGNVREFENMVRLVVTGHHGRAVRAEDLPEYIRRQASRRQLSLLERLEFEAIIAANERSRGSKTEAAAVLGISRATLYRKMRTYGIPMGTSTP